MTDIVDRLRGGDDTPLRSKWLMREAAEEIERLRERLKDCELSLRVANPESIYWKGPGGFK